MPLSCARPKRSYYIAVTYEMPQTTRLSWRLWRKVQSQRLIASNSDMTNCRNQTGMPGINMSYFSKDKILPQKWIRFVQIKRKDFLPVKKPALCCAHLEDTVVLMWWCGSSVKERFGFLFQWLGRSCAMFIKQVRYISVSGSARRCINGVPTQYCRLPRNYLFVWQSKKLQYSSLRRFIRNLSCIELLIEAIHSNFCWHETVLFSKYMW